MPRANARQAGRTPTISTTGRPSTSARRPPAGTTVPGVAIAVKGAWPKLDPARRNVNILHAGRKADMGESTAVHGIEVTVTAVV